VTKLRQQMQQRQARKPDPKYLAWLRRQGCACGCHQPPPCDAAHVRASSAKYLKRNALGKKPDDMWALPLKHAHHMAQHAHGDELGWWSAHGVDDPFALALRYYRKFNRSK